jgi:hypothetical protein
MQLSVILKTTYTCRVFNSNTQYLALPVMKQAYDWFTDLNPVCNKIEHKIQTSGGFTEGYGNPTQRIPP